MWGLHCEAAGCKHSHCAKERLVGKGLRPGQKSNTRRVGQVLRIPMTCKNRLTSNANKEMKKIRSEMDGPSKDLNDKI